MAKLLLDTGKVDVGAKDKDGWTPLSLAAVDRSNSTFISMHLLLSTLICNKNPRFHAPSTQLAVCIQIVGGEAMPLPLRIEQ